MQARFSLVAPPGSPQAPAMESHEWSEKTDGAKVYYRANFIGGRWTIMTTTMKRDPEWADLRVVPLDVWRELRDIVWKKYQRKRCPWERVADLDRIIDESPPTV
jgi:hypothetical protein